MRRRLVLSTTAVTLAVLIAVGVPLVLVVRRLAIAEASDVLQRQAESIATDLADVLASGGVVTVVDLQRRIPPGDQLLLETATGNRVVAGTSIAGDTISVEVSAVRGTRLELRTSAAPVERRIRTALVSLAVLGLGAVAGAAALAAWEARRIARPLDELAEAARRIGSGDFSATVGRSGVEEIDTIADALDAAARRIGELVRAERAFSANASHQLRTALTSMRLRLESLAAAPDPATRRDASAALAQAERLSDVVDDLLRLARTGRAADAAPVFLGALVRSHVADLEPRLTAAGRRAVVDAPEAVVVHSAAGAIGQALDVLLDNAVRHGDGAVTVRVESASGSATITVADEGRGVTAEQAASLFDGTAAPGGHGIGLRLARTLVEADGGRLDLVEPSPATFRITLPLS